MKKLFFLMLVVHFSFSGYTMDLDVTWLVSGNSKLVCKKISLGYSKARIVLENGEKKSIPIELINSYSLNGQIFTKLQLYNNGESTGQMVFMELINTYGELSLYRFTPVDIKPSNHHEKKYRYFLYKGDTLNLTFDEKDMPEIPVHFERANYYK